MSLAVTVAGAGIFAVPSQSAISFAGTPERVGSKVSSILIVRVIVTSFPQISLAVMLCKIVEPQVNSVVVELGV